jgi:hypothetical protein
VPEVLDKRGDAPGLVCILSAMEPCSSYKPWHDDLPGTLDHLFERHVVDAYAAGRSRTDKHPALVGRRGLDRRNLELLRARASPDDKGRDCKLKADDHGYRTAIILSPDEAL